MTYYQLLEIDADANQEAIKKSYRRLAKQYHPDANPGNKAAEEKFKQIAAAYEVLSDPQRRANYDFLLFQRSRQPYQPNHQSYSRPYAAEPKYESQPSVDHTNPWRIVRFFLWGLLFVLQWRACNQPKHEYTPDRILYFQDSAVVRVDTINDSVIIKRVPERTIIYK